MAVLVEVDEGHFGAGDQDFLRGRVHPDDHDRVFAEVERTHTTGDDFRLEYRLIAADGRTVWVHDETVAVRDAQYKPLFLQGFLIDVSDRHADERAPVVEQAHRPALRPAAS